MGLLRKITWGLLLFLAPLAFANVKPNLLIINLGDGSNPEVQTIFESAAARFANAYGGIGYQVFHVHPGPRLFERTFEVLRQIPDGGLAIEILGHGQILSKAQISSKLHEIRFPTGFVFINGVGLKQSDWLDHSLGIGDLTSMIHFYQSRFPKAVVKVSSNSCFGGAAAQQLALLPGVMTFSMASDNAVSILKSTDLTLEQSDVTFIQSIEKADAKVDSHLEAFNRAREEYLSNYKMIPILDLAVPRNPLDSFALGWCSHQNKLGQRSLPDHPLLNIHFGGTLELNKNLTETVNQQAGCQKLDASKFPLAQERLSRLAWSLVDEMERRLPLLSETKYSSQRLYSYIGKSGAIEAKKYYLELITNIRTECRNATKPVHCVEKMVNQANVSRFFEATDSAGAPPDPETGECKIDGYTLFKDSCWTDWNQQLIEKNPRRAVGFLYAFKDFAETQTAKCLRQTDRVKAYKSCFNEFLHRAHAADQAKFFDLVRAAQAPIGKLTRDY